jgi:hypothetical protein
VSDDEIQALERRILTGDVAAWTMLDAALARTDRPHASTSQAKILEVFECARSAGDMAGHAAIKSYRERAGLRPEIPTAFMGDANWDEAFGVTGDTIRTWLDGVEYDHAKNNPADVRPGLDPLFDNLAPFDRRDVKRVLGTWVNDDNGWSGEALMELWDGRYAYLQAGCDYSGWG